MTRATDVLTTLQRAGCRFILDGDMLGVQDYNCILTDDLRQVIRQNKQALLAILNPQPPRHAGGIPITDADHPCSLCNGVEWQQHVTYRYCLTCGQEAAWGDSEFTQGKRSMSKRAKR